MKLLFQGDKGKTICEHCGPVTTTYLYRDVPLSDSGKVVKDILVGECDKCHSVASIPAQSTPAIKAEREKAIKSIEAVLPAPYIEVLDMAAFKVSSSATTEMRKYLVLAYLHKQLESKAKPSDWTVFELGFAKGIKLPTRRFSIKVSSKMEDEFLSVKDMFNMSKTDTLKTIINEIKEDILDKGNVSPEIQMIGKMTLA
jgi:hypothetical protein